MFVSGNSSEGFQKVDGLEYFHPFCPGRASRENKLVTFSILIIRSDPKILVKLLPSSCESAFLKKEREGAEKKEGWGVMG